MMKLLKTFIFLLCFSNTICAYVYLGGNDPIHRRSRVDNHDVRVPQRQTGILPRVRVRSSVPIAAATSRKKPVVHGFQNVNTKRQLFARRPLLNSKRQLFPRGPLLNPRRQFFPRRPLLNLKRQLFQRRPLLNSKRQLFPRRPLLNSRRQLFPRRPLLNSRNQLFPRRPLLNSRRHLFPRRPLVNSNRQLYQRRPLLNTKRQLFPRIPLLNAKTQLLQRRPLANRKRQLFPRGPLLNRKTQLFPRRPLLNTKGQLFPRRPLSPIPFRRPQSRTSNLKPKYVASSVVPVHTIKNHIPVFHNTANSAGSRNVRPRQKEQDKFLSWNDFAEIKTPVLNILPGKKYVIHKPNRETIFSSSRQRPRSNVPNRTPSSSISRHARVQPKNDIPSLRITRLPWSHNGARFHDREQYKSNGWKKSVVNPIRRTNVFETKNSRAITRQPITEHVFSFTFQRPRSKIPSETSQPIFPRLVVPQRERNVVPRFRGNIVLQRNAAAAAEERYMDTLSKRFKAIEVNAHVRSKEHMDMSSKKSSTKEIELNAHVPGKDHIDISSKRSSTKEIVLNIRVPSKEHMDISSRRSSTKGIELNARAPSKQHMDISWKRSYAKETERKDPFTTRDHYMDTSSKRISHKETERDEPFTTKDYYMDTSSKRSPSKEAQRNEHIPTNKHYIDSSWKKYITKETTPVSKLEGQNLNHEIHKLPKDLSALTFKRTKTRASAKRQRFLIPKLIPTQITKSQIPNYLELLHTTHIDKDNLLWKKSVKPSQTSVQVKDNNAVKKSLVKTSQYNATNKTLPDVNVPAVHEYGNALNVDAQREIHSKAQLKPVLLETQENPYKGDSVVAKKETVSQVHQMNEENPSKGDNNIPKKEIVSQYVDSRILDDNGSKKHLTETPHGIITSSKFNEKTARKRYRQLGISNEFMDMKSTVTSTATSTGTSTGTSTAHNNVVNDDIDEHIETTRQNSNNDIVEKSRLNKYTGWTNKKNVETSKLNNNNNNNNINNNVNNNKNNNNINNNSSGNNYYNTNNNKDTAEALKIYNNSNSSNKENTEVSKLNTNTENDVGSKVSHNKQKLVADSHDIKARVDKSEFKNSSGHEIKLLTPSKKKDSSPETSKPYYIKESKPNDLAKEAKVDDDEECTVEAQKKGECINDMRKPPFIDNKNNQLGIATSHNQPAMGEMPSINAKGAPSAQCQCQGKEDCSCDLTASPAPAVVKPINNECTCEKVADCSCPAKNVPAVSEVSKNVPAVSEGVTEGSRITNECSGHTPCPLTSSSTDVVSIVKPSNVSVCSAEDTSCAVAPSGGTGGEAVEAPEAAVTANECVGQQSPCVCAPNTPCTCTPNCAPGTNTFSNANGGSPPSSPSDSPSLSACSGSSCPAVKKPCCATSEGCPSGSSICTPPNTAPSVVPPSVKPSMAASVTSSGCSESCAGNPTCVPCPSSGSSAVKGPAGWLPLSAPSATSAFSSGSSGNDSPEPSSSTSDNAPSTDMGKVNIGNFDCQGNTTDTGTVNGITRDTLCATFLDGVAIGSDRNYAFVEDLPNVKGILASSFSKKKYNFRSCDFLATANKNGVEVRLHPTPACSQISFSSLIQQLLGGEYDLAGPSDNLIVIGKFDAVGFNIDKIRERISFSLQCKELMDIIPNKLRIASGKVLLNFSYDSLPKSISDFVIKIEGLIHLNYRSRVLNINVDKAIDSTLFMIDMAARDLELPEFTKLFTQTEIIQDDLPSDLATLVTSSLRNPRISGLYDSGGAFEFVASAKSPPSIFPLQPMVYVIIQKPRLGKVVSGMIVNFERAMYKTLLSSILDKDLSQIPLFKDIRTDLALGVSTDGLYVIKDALFNKEVGSLFDSGKPIKKGLTFKAKLPIGKMINEGNNSVGMMGSGPHAVVSGSSDGVPENVLIDCEVTGNKMHLQFPEGLSLSLMNVGGFFGEEGQDMNFPTVSGELGRNVLSIKNYEVDNIEKKSVTVSFVSDTSMKIGSLMTLGNIEAQLKRDEYTKWSFVCTGDYQLGDTSVSVSLTSETDGFIISSKPSSIRSLLLVDVLDKTEEILKSELQMYHMDDFVVEDFRISGSLKSSNIIRFAGKPALFGVETSVIEFVATQEESGNDLLAMGLLFENVNLDKVFGRMLDRNLLRRSWAVGTNIGLFVSSSKTATDLRFEMGGLAKTRIQPGNHLRVLLLRPEPQACKGDSLCKVLSAEMPIGSAFLLDGYMVDGTLKLSETIKDPLVLSKSLVLKSVALKMRIKDSVEIYVTGGLTLPNVEGVGFTGELRVDNTGHLQLKMGGNDTWHHPFGLKNVAFFNSTLSAAFEPGFPVPTMDVHGDISIGTEPLDTLKSLLGPVNVKINSGPNGRNTFTAKIKDINFEKLALATGSKRTLLRFQKEALFLDDAVLTYGPIKNEVTKEATTRDTTPSDSGHDKNDDDENDNSNEKSEIKLTGRMRVLGSLSDYTMKFLQDGTQLLAEVQMPDIGVNHGELTIKAGLKRHSVHSDPQSPKGPTLLIRMDPTMNSGIIVGRISALGFSRLSAIKVEDEGFSSMMFGQLPGNHSTNVTLHSMFEANLEDANFQISACLPVQKPVKEALMNYLQDKATLTKKTLISGEDRVQKTEDIFKKTSSNIKNYEDVANLFLAEMRMKGDQLVKLKEELKRRCVPDCGESCMGLPTWKPSGISLNGKDAIGAPSWSPCNRKIPDLSCIVRCLGEKVIGNVRANRKQVELQGLISSLAETKNIIRTNRMYDARARNLVNSTASGLNKIKNTIQVGSDISNFMGAKDNNILINNICFQDSLDNAERSLVNFEATTNINGQEKKMVIPSTLDGNTEYNIAEGIANTIFPGFFDFNKNLEQVKVLFSNLDGERDEIEKLMGKTNELMEKSTVEVRSEVDWNPEEIEFRKLAFGELPRFTLSDDETMHAFDDQSIWNIAPQNDPLFSKLKEDTTIAQNKSAYNAFAQEFANGNACDQLKRSINHYGDVINALTEFTKKFLQERNIFHRQKNHRLADLRMIDDQIKSDCFIENCTMEDMDNALSYLGKAKYGTLRWANVIENQIEEQNKIALQYFSHRAGDIVEASQGLSLRRYIVNVKSMASNAIKKTTIPGKELVENDIKEIGKEMYHLLVGVKNSDELSTASPKIFKLKRQIQTLDRSRNLCANMSEAALDNLDEFPSKEGTEYTAKHQVVKENFMNSKFLSHKDIDDDFVSPIIKESELDDDDEDTRTEDSREINNENSNEEVNFSVEESEPNAETNSVSTVAGEQRDVFPQKHSRRFEHHITSADPPKDPPKDDIHTKIDTPNANVKLVETHPDQLNRESNSSETSTSSIVPHHSKEERLMSEFKMINDDVLSFNNDLRLDLPEKRTTP